MQKFVVLFLAALTMRIRGADRAGASTSDILDKLAKRFWSWRRKDAPFTGDDGQPATRTPRRSANGRRAAIVDKRGRDLKI